MKEKKIIQPIFCLSAALIWGFSFVAQKSGSENIPVFTFNALRYAIGAALLLPFSINRAKKVKLHSTDKKMALRNTLIGGLLCGLTLFAATTFQQLGISLQDASTNVGKAGFITACYCVLVPIFGLLFFKRKVPSAVWPSLVGIIAGYFFLCLMDSLLDGEGLSLNLSDFLVSLCAVSYTFQVLLVDKYTSQSDEICLCYFQLFFCALFSFVAMLLLETPDLQSIKNGLFPLLYSGIGSSAIAYTLQFLGQKDFNPSVASLLFSLESVFSVLGGVLFYPGSSLSMWEYLGCLLVFASVVFVNISGQKQQ